jgi:hypothetical protein
MIMTATAYFIALSRTKLEPKSNVDGPLFMSVSRKAAINQNSISLTMKPLPNSKKDSKNTISNTNLFHRMSIDGMPPNGPSEPTRITSWLFLPLAIQISQSSDGIVYYSRQN